jgi:hypothetical protein
MLDVVDTDFAADIFAGLEQVFQQMGFRALEFEDLFLDRIGGDQLDTGYHLVLTDAVEGSFETRKIDRLID